MVIAHTYDELELILSETPYKKTLPEFIDLIDFKDEWNTNPLTFRAMFSAGFSNRLILCIFANSPKVSDRLKRLLACMFAEYVLPFFENKYPDDKRIYQAIEVSRRFANGMATRKELIEAERTAIAAVDMINHVTGNRHDLAECAAYTATCAAVSNFPASWAVWIARTGALAATVVNDIPSEYEWQINCLLELVEEA